MTSRPEAPTAARRSDRLPTSHQPQKVRRMTTLARAAAAVAAAGLVAGGCSMFSEDPPPAAPAAAAGTSFSQADLVAAADEAASRVQEASTAALLRLEREHERDLRNLAATYEAGIAERERIATEQAERLGKLAAQHAAELSAIETAHQQERMLLENDQAEMLQRTAEMERQAAEQIADYEWFIEFVGTTADCVAGAEGGSSSECYVWERPVRDLYQDWVMYPHEAQALVDDIIASESVDTVIVRYGSAEYIEFVCEATAGGCATQDDGVIHILADLGVPPEAVAGSTHSQGARRTVLHEVGHQIFYHLPKQPGLFGMFDSRGEPRDDDREAEHGHASLLFRCVVADLYVERLGWDIPHRDAVQRVCAQTGFVFTSERDTPRPDVTAEDETVDG